jgi:hypothetical protein
MVQYKVRLDRVAENEELVRAVYDELQRTRPVGLRYATFQLPDAESVRQVRLGAARLRSLLTSKRTAVTKSQ